jgi:hypothetical protein
MRLKESMVETKRGTKVMEVIQYYAYTNSTHEEEGKQNLPKKFETAIVTTVQKRHTLHNSIKTASIFRTWHRPQPLEKSFWGEKRLIHNIVDQRDDGILLLISAVQGNGCNMVL